jgi:hypothetical protein
MIIGEDQVEDIEATILDSETPKKLVNQFMKASNIAGFLNLDKIDEVEAMAEGTLEIN